MAAHPQAARAEAFRQLHHGPDVLVLANAWDVASARLLEEAGFPAVATTSSGIAFSHGLPDGERIRREEMLAVVERIARALRVPVTADLEAGYGPAPEDVAATVRGAIEAGAVGCNLEDSMGDPAQPLIETGAAAERCRAARAAAEAAGVPIVLNARTDGFLRGGALGVDPFEQTVQRARAYLAAGADSIFIPGVRDADTIGRLVEHIDAPVNILAGPGAPSIAELQALGVARVSVGGSLMRATLTAVTHAAQELRTAGTYGYAEGALTHAALNAFFER